MHFGTLAITIAVAMFSFSTVHASDIEYFKKMSAGCARCGKVQSKQIQHRSVLVIGCPRSGTGYIWKVLRTCGMEVGHEKDGQHGVVSWLFSTDSNNPAWGPKPNDYHFEHIFHQVRHPLKCIATMHLVVNRAWDYICREVPEIKRNDPILVRCAKMWVYWNLMAEKKAEMTYRVEAIEKNFPEICKRLERPLDITVLKKVSKTTHSTPHEYVVTWEDLHKALEPEFYKKLLLQAKRYGYDIKEGMDLIR